LSAVGIRSTVAAGRIPELSPEHAETERGGRRVAASASSAKVRLHRI